MTAASSFATDGAPSKYSEDISGLAAKAFEPYDATQDKPADDFASLETK